ncbi:hypothetical protein E3P86_02773 [Wallemia ichthyophaga]|uniref:Uncharacterized protein n=2 Tax=Wallemia ichthyophaga TaxID=245174 RepID=A0A4V4M4V8_WALIC|nr:hypothetical protein E3P86_02773 [Wallemia ichthyophaga]
MEAARQRDTDQSTDQSTSSSINLMQAVTNQITYIDDTGGGDELKLYYYRMSGSTALHPGLNRICIKLKHKPMTQQISPRSILLDGLPNIPNTSNNAFFDPISKMPTPSTYGPLLDIFFRDLVQFFPFLERGSVESRLRNGTMSAFLVNAICGTAVRFVPPPDMNPVQASLPYIQQANTLLIELLRLPTTDTVAGLLLLSYCEFGQNSESGLWQFSGMAIRMAFDLGLHNSTVDALFESPDEARRARLLFWTLFVMDRVLSFGTGRPSSMSENVEITLPESSHQPPLPAFVPFAPPNQIPWCFPVAVKMIILVGRISDTLNCRDVLRRRRSNDTQDVEAQNNDRRHFLEAQLREFYTNLPSDIKWSVENLKLHAANGQGGLYLFIHLWYNAVLAFVDQHQTPGSNVTEASLKSSLNSAQMISECLVFADLFTNQSYLASPFISQPLFIAACAFVHDARVNHNVSLGPLKKSTDSNDPLSVPAEVNADKVYKALKRMTIPWQGIGYIVNLLEQRASVSGLDQVDFSLTSDAIQSFISLPDSGIVQKLSRTPPQKPSPPTTATQTPTIGPEVAPAMEYAPAESNTSSNQGMDNLPSLNPPNISMEELLSNHFIQEITASPTSFDFGELSNLRGTVKYFGPVDSTDGLWCGIEWDDSSRGKHSGDKDGKQYFKTKIPFSATFVRPSKKIHTGQSFLNAFKQKYAYSDDKLEFAPNIDRISKKLSQTSQLKVAGLEHMAVFGIGDSDKDQVRREAQSLRQLSLAHSLISSMEDVDKLVEYLPSIQELDISSNRVAIWNRPYPHLHKLKILKLNNTLTDYSEVVALSDSLGSLEELELGYNGIELLKDAPIIATLHTLIMSHNNISEWNEVEKLLRMSSLQTLNIDSNKIARIPYKPRSVSPNNSIKTLILSRNEIKDWISVDALALQVPQLESLSLTDCPIMSTQTDVGKARQKVIARFEKLHLLNLSEVSIEERKDAEYFYIKNIPTEEDPKQARYKELCEKYDYQPSSQPSKTLTHLQMKKLNIELRMDSKTYPLTTISSIPVKKLRVIVERMFGISHTKFKLTATMIPQPNMMGQVEDERTDVDLDDDYKDLRDHVEYTTSVLPRVVCALSGVTVDVFFYPVDTLKTRLQSTQGFIKAGGFRNIYKGVGSVAFGGAPGAAAFFTTYETLKKAIPTISSFSNLPDAAVHMIAGSGGETAACLIRVPTEVVKSRQQTMAYGSVSSLKAAQLLISQEGLKGFYRGFGITVFREIPFTSVQFPLYEYLKSRVARYKGRDHARPHEGALCGTVAGAVAAGSTTPLDVIKTRTMLSKERISFATVISSVYNQGGYRAFFAGLVPRVAWISAGGAVFLGVYEVGLDVLDTETHMEHPQDLAQSNSQQSAKEWAFQQDNHLRMAAALNHGSYGDSSGIMTRHRAAMAARNMQSPGTIPNGLTGAALPHNMNSPLNSMYSLQTPLPIGRLPLTPTTASSSCVTRSTSPTNSVASTSQTSFSFQQQQAQSAAATPSPKHSPSPHWMSNQIPGIQSLMAPSPSGSSNTSAGSSIGPRRKTKLINETRRAICVFAEENPSARQEDIASRYQIERSTVSKILKQKDKWKSIIPGGASARVAKHRPSKFPDIESRLSAWAQDCALTNYYLTDHAIREKAKTVARSLGYPEEKFKASSGWVEKFKERNNIRKGKVNGATASGSGTPSAVSTVSAASSFVQGPESEMGSATPSEHEETTDYLEEVNQVESPAAQSYTYTHHPQQHQVQSLSHSLPAQTRHDGSYISAPNYALSDHHANNHLLALASAAVAVDDLNHEKYSVEQERMDNELAWIMELKRKLSHQPTMVDLIKSDAIQITRFYEQGSLSEGGFKQAIEMLCAFTGLDFTYGVYDIRSYLIDRMNTVLSRL